MPHSAAADTFRQSILAGLKRTPKHTEPRWLYDEVGAKLFEAITKLDTYYVTRTELSILKSSAAEIADALGEGVTIVEPGSGEALKVRPLLDALGDKAGAYVPIDIAADQLAQVSDDMAARYPNLAVRPVAADFFSAFDMPKVERGVVFFPGSTIGNMPAETGVAFLSNLMERSGATRCLIGFDLVKDKDVLETAYDDPAGVTRAFKLNLLQRINRELGAAIDVSAFEYECQYNEATQAVEMFVVAKDDYAVTIAGERIAFRAGERINTEDSRKYTLESFAEFAAGAGLTPLANWRDERDYFALMLLERR